MGRHAACLAATASLLFATGAAAQIVTGRASSNTIYNGTKNPVKAFARIGFPDIDGGDTWELKLRGKGSGVTVADFDWTDAQSYLWRVDFTPGAEQNTVTFAFDTGAVSPSSPVTFTLNSEGDFNTVFIEARADRPGTRVRIDGLNLSVTAAAPSGTVGEAADANGDDAPLDILSIRVGSLPLLSTHPFTLTGEMRMEFANAPGVPPHGRIRDSQLLEVGVELRLVEVELLE